MKNIITKSRKDEITKQTNTIFVFLKFRAFVISSYSMNIERVAGK